MALYVVDDMYSERVYHVGAGVIVESLPNVIEILADGHELEKIKAQFSNIPMYKGRCVVWRGDMARFIVANLVL